MRAKHFITCSFLLLLVLPLSAQDEPAPADTNTGCAEVLNQAEEEFSAGHFYGIPSLLKDCLDNFSDEQKVRAYMLLSQAYLLIDDPIGAEDSYLKLLKANPEYVADEVKDPIDIFYLSKKFTATPIFTPHVRIGLNTALFRLIDEINTDPYPVNRKDRTGFGFHFGGGMDWNINDNISLAAEIDYVHRVFKTTRSSDNDPRIQIAKEKQTWFDVPVYLKYRASSGKIRPFGYAGVALNMLLASKVELSSVNKYPTLGGNSQKISEGPDVNIKYKRNTINRSLVFGGGALYKIGKDYLFADLRYMPGLSNVSNKNTFYEDNKTDMALSATKYSWLGDYFRLDNVSISFGYVYPLYYPRKVKHARTKSAFRKIEKQTDEN